MIALLRRALLTRLAALSVAAGCGAAAVAAELLELPERVIGELFEAGLDADWRAEDRRRLLHVLASDPRASVRCAAADTAPWAAAGSLEEAEDLIRPLVRDPAPCVRETAAAALGRLAESVPLFDRAQFVSSWARAPHPGERQAAARALALWPVFGADVVLAHLARDPAPRVRRRAMEAVAARFPFEPSVLEDSVAAALSDPDRRVRRLARKLFVQASRRAAS
jgi:hypothetical protein